MKFLRRDLGLLWLVNQAEGEDQFHSQTYILALFLLDFPGTITSHFHSHP